MIVHISDRRLRKYGLSIQWLKLMQETQPLAAARALHALSPIEQRKNPGHARHFRKRWGLSPRQYRKLTRSLEAQ